MNKNLWGEQEKSRRKWSEQEYACTEQDDGINNIEMIEVNWVS